MMKTFFILSFISAFCCVNLYGQSTLIKGVEETAKKKVEAQDFNTTRSNRQNSNYDAKSKAKEAPAPVSPAPAPKASEQEVSPTPDPANSEQLSTATYQAAYTFDAMLTYKMESYKGEKSETETITYWFGDKQAAFKVSNKSMYIIYDPKNNSSIMIDDEKKTATVMSMSMFQSVMNKTVSNTSTEAKITKTGNTKTILGYVCDEYLIESDHKSIAWITQTATNIVSTKDFSDLFMKTNPYMKNENFNATGTMLESTSYDKDGKIQVHLTATEMKKESITKNIGAYKISDLSSMQKN